MKFIAAAFELFILLFSLCVNKAQTGKWLK